MIKTRSKPKIKPTSSNPIKKSLTQKPKIVSKDKKAEEKENILYPKFSTSALQSKKKLKASGEAETQRQISPLCLNRKGKNEDEKFIQKLFEKSSKYQNLKQKKADGFFVEKLIEGLVPQNGRYSFKNTGQTYESVDFVRQLQLKNQQVVSLKHQIEELKLYISNFIFKVFDLTVLCRKNLNKIDIESDNYEFNKKNDEVIAYLDSIIRHWRLEQTIKSHCQNIVRKVSITDKNRMIDSRKRCHTESLKIPIEDYLQTLKATSSLKFEQNFESFKKRNTVEQEQSQQIMRILSRRSSGRIQKQEDQIYTVLRGYEAKNVKNKLFQEHQLQVKPGQRVSILQKTDNEKWLGFKQGKVGYFPKQCLF